MARTKDRLYRSSSERMLVGVCGGLAEYFDVDPVIVRVAFVVLLFAGGAGLILYFALAIIMPTDEQARGAGAAQPLTTQPPRTPGDAASVSSDSEVNAKGAQPAEAQQVEPSPVVRSRRRQAAGIVLVLIGALWLLANFGAFFWLNWEVFWPVLLVVAGAAIIVGRLRSR